MRTSFGNPWAKPCAEPLCRTLRGSLVRNFVRQYIFADIFFALPLPSPLLFPIFLQPYAAVCTHMVFLEWMGLVRLFVFPTPICMKILVNPCARPAFDNRFLVHLMRVFFRLFFFQCNTVLFLRPFVAESTTLDIISVAESLGLKG